ncbi:hypothetical protein NDU88_001163 [Pleurodeles waltl]|uniref:Uncharacterized protein n=1 Tax=Pleurodeles waltl TaxID=8319 RepID=A0AAV7VZA0_PLEWA|nr:hypothetical protein NDU88_001163 [Pleurodeles waltl]
MGSREASAIGRTRVPGIALLWCARSRPIACSGVAAADLGLAGRPAQRDTTNCGRAGDLRPAGLPSRLGAASPCADRSAPELFTAAPRGAGIL